MTSVGLSVDRLEVGYGRVSVLQSLSIFVPAGQVVAVIGPNGAGKSTLLRTISGLLQPKSGSILVGTEEIQGMAPERIAAHGVLHVPETRDIFPEMTVWENLKVSYDNLGRTEDEDVAFGGVYDLFPLLKERTKQAAGTLSGGQQQMLAIGRALLAQPRVLMLDEPSLGLAQIVIASIYAALGRLKERGLTILLIEQNANLALRFSDHAHVLVNGRIVMSGPSGELRGRDDIFHHYLGGAAISEDNRELQGEVL